MPLISRREKLRRALDLPETPSEMSKDSVPMHDFRAWAEDFHKWALSECCFRDRCFGGIGALCAEFGRWAVEHDSVPCTRATFESLLRDQGFFCADGMVSGLILKADLWAVERAKLVYGELLPESMSATDSPSREKPTRARSLLMPREEVQA